jgi:hypothetical protein
MSETTFQTEPEAPAIFSERPLEGFEIKRQGQQENQDRIDWEQDLQERRSRLSPKRIEPVSIDIVSTLADLEPRAQGYVASRCES